MSDLPPSMLSWPDPDSGPWSVVVHWREIDGRAECIGLELWNGTQVGGAAIPDRSAAPITAQALRALRPDAMVKSARNRSARTIDAVVDAQHEYIRGQNEARLAELGLDSWTKPSPFTDLSGGDQPDVLEPGAPQTLRFRQQAAALRKSSPWPAGAKRRGRPPGKAHSQDHWERIAAMYREARQSDRNPTKEIYERLIEAGDDVAYSTVSTWIGRCREMGLLPKTTQGKARS